MIFIKLRTWHFIGMVALNIRMLKNYLKTALRSLWHHKGFSFLNIAGLAIGMSAFFLIAQYVRLETSYDDFVPKKDRIFRLVVDIRSPASNLPWASTTAAMAINLKKDYPEVADFVRLIGSSFILRRGDKKFQEDNTVMADSSLFRIFDYPLLRGDPQTALKEPFSLVLSRSTAKKYFGDNNPLGQTILIGDGGDPARVTGVMEDLPENSSLKADLFLSMSSMKKYRDSDDYNWGNFNDYSYLLLSPGANAAVLEAKMPSFIERHIGPVLKQQKQDYVLSLEKLKDVYTSKRGGFVSGNQENVYIFSIVGLFILLVACINFVNLTTARSTERAKEVGVRKVVGAARGQLTGQFLGESLIITTLAFVLSLGLCGVLLPLFNQLAGKTVIADIFGRSSNIGVLFLISITIGLLAGIYPAIILSGFQPITSLKGRFSTSTRGLFLRKSLVVLQFTVSTVLITGTFVVYSQLHYMRSRDLGFNKAQTLVVNTYRDPHQQAFRQKVLTLPGVRSAVLSGAVPGWGNWIAYTNIENAHGDMQSASLDLNLVDFGFLQQYDLRLLAGRYFSKEIATDTMQAMIINEKALSLFGYSSPQAALGRKFEQWGKKGTIIGVIKDFHFDGLQQEIKPLSICLGPDDCKLLSVKLSNANLPATIAAIKSEWTAINSTKDFDYFFLDEFFDRQYRAEERFGSLFMNFAILAIMISCLGLLGLASYSTLQRTKEIGVRRVLGASVTGIVQLLSADFLKLVMIAFLVSCPIAWFAMHRWLRDFAYQTSLSWWIFAGSGIVALTIAFGTISYQAIRAAVASPVKSLGSE
jgi:putative ABC transport system permease protein